MLEQNFIELCFFRIFEKAMAGNTNQRQQKNEFDLFKKKETSKKEKKQDISFKHCIACLTTWPVSISTRVLDVIEPSAIPAVRNNLVQGSLE